MIHNGVTTFGLRYINTSIDCVNTIDIVTIAVASCTTTHILIGINNSSFISTVMVFFCSRRIRTLDLTACVEIPQ